MFDYAETFESARFSTRCTARAILIQKLEANYKTENRDGQFVILGFGRKCTVYLSAGNHEAPELIVEGQATYTRKLRTFQCAFIDLRYDAFKIAYEAEQRAVTVRDTAKEAVLGAVRAFANEALDDGDAMIHGKKQSEWAASMVQLALSFAALVRAEMVKDGFDFDKSFDDVCAEAVHSWAVQRYRHTWESMGTAIHRDDLLDVDSPEAAKQEFAEFKAELDANWDAVEEAAEEAKKEEEEVTEERRECLAAEISHDFSVYTCADGWDYDAGIVDADVTEEELQQAQTIAEKEQEPIHVIRDSEKTRLIAPLWLVARTLAPLIDDGAYFDDDPRELIEQRRIEVWDPTGDETGIDDLFSGWTAEVLHSACGIVRELEVESEHWSEASLRVLYKHDDESYLREIREFQARLIALNDPCCEHYIGDGDQEYRRIRHGLEADIERHVRDNGELFGLDEEDVEAQLSDAMRDLQTVEDDVNWYDFT